MPPPRGTANVLEGPGDYDVTSTVHSNTYPEINPGKANLTGMAVFITGASRGIGRSIALSYAGAGVSYIAAGARSDMVQLGKDIETAAMSANRPLPKFLPLKLDITDQESVEEAASAVRRQFGKLDIVVNNAGVLLNNTNITESDPDMWWRDITINLKGPYLVSRAFIPLLLEGGTKYLIFISSVGMHCVTPGLSAYQVAKSAIFKLCAHIDSEYSQKGLITFCVHPGNVPTDGVGGMDGLPDHLKPVFVDSLEICGHSLIYLTKEKRSWLSGRYINVTWNMPELVAKKEEIIKGDKLKLKLDY